MRVIPAHRNLYRRQGAGRFFSICLLLLAGSPATLASSLVERSKISDPSEIWSAWGGQVQFRFAPMVLRDMQLEINTPEQTIKGALSYDAPPLQMAIANLGSLAFHAPFGHFEGFVDGRLTINQPMRMRLAGGPVVSWQTMLITPRQTGRFPGLQIHDGSGNLLFTVDNIHVYVDQISKQLVMKNLDIMLARDLADSLGEVRFADKYIGGLEFGVQLNIPDGASKARGGGVCDERPKWSTDGHVVDVGLVMMGAVEDVGTLENSPATFELIAPSSQLKNLMGLDGADVPWFAQFTGPAPPHNNDQHPYLVWNMYRVDNTGKIEQIGRSAAKHAFFTVNMPGCIAPTPCTNVDFPGVDQDDNHVLWPGCEDIYGVGTNDNRRYLGPREEINPLTGVFVSKGSFFDPNSDGEQENFSDATGENRMQVLRQDLETPGAEYFFESWYVIRDDSDIFNSMGYRPTTPDNTGGDNWSYGLGDFQKGPVIDEWVNPTTDPASGSQNVDFFDENIGHFKLAVKTTGLGNAQYRYDYMLMNFDINDGISALTFAGVGDVEPTSIDFHDVDQDADNNWSVTQAPLRFAAAAGKQMPWGNGYTFSFIAGPPAIGKVSVTIGDSAGSSIDQSIDMLMPLREIFLLDGFESPDP